MGFRIGLGTMNLQVNIGSLVLAFIHPFLCDPVTQLHGLYALRYNKYALDMIRLDLKFFAMGFGMAVKTCQYRKQNPFGQVLQCISTFEV